MSDMDSVLIREFQQSDRPLVEAFFEQMGGESRAMFNRGDGNRNWAMKFFEGDTQAIVRFLAEDGERMVGYVFLYDTHTLVPWLGIAVAEDYKGRHLGRKLMEHAHRYAKETGAGGVMLTTAYANSRGQGLYEHMGYERLGMHSSGELLYIHRFRRE